MPSVRPLLAGALLAPLPVALLTGRGADSPTSIAGRVRDAGGRPVAGVVVTAAHVALPVAATTQTGADGRFRLDGVPAGSYRVVARHRATSGAAAARDSVRLEGRATLDLSLAPDGAAAAESLGSAAILAALPAGDAKRKLLLDCTGCHQMGERQAFPGGAPRDEAGWTAVVERMLSYGGATGGFPVIHADRDARATAAWLARHLAARPAPPAPRAASADAARAVVTEYFLPVAQDLAHDVAVDSSGRVVITGMFSHRMYVLDPARAELTPVDIPVPKANPRAVEIDSSGSWWVLLGGPRAVARYAPGEGRWRTFDVGMYPHSLAPAGDGRVWFNGHFTRDPELIGFVDPARDTVRTVAVPPHPTMAAVAGGPIPYELRLAPDGRVWISELHGNRLVAHDPRTGTFEVFDLPVPHAGPRRFDIDRRGVVWIPAYAANELLRLDPATRRFSRHPLPVADAVPYVARVDHGSGAVWIGTSAGDVALRFDPATERFSVFPLPSAGALVRHIAIDPRTHDVWLAYGAAPGIAARVARLRVAR